MKILYGINGVGNGHLSRGRTLIPILQSLGHEVKIIISGRDRKSLFGIENLPLYQCYPGLAFKISKGKIHYWQSIKSPNLIRSLHAISQIKLKHVDLVITDFEPITAYWAKINKVPSLGIGNQYAFHYNIPADGMDLVSRFIIRYFAPADYKLGLYWHHYCHQNILPPIISPSPIFQSKTKKIKNKILVYLPSEDLQHIINVLKNFKAHIFYVYCQINQQRRMANIYLKPYSLADFQFDLATSDKVLCNAGFQLPTEALALGKNLLVKATKRHGEQTTNAINLKTLKLAKMMHSLNIDVIAEWLKDPEPKPVEYPNVALHLARWIDREDWNNVNHLFQLCWK